MIGHTKIRHSSDYGNTDLYHVISSFKHAISSSLTVADEGYYENDDGKNHMFIREYHVSQYHNSCQIFLNQRLFGKRIANAESR